MTIEGAIKKIFKYLMVATLSLYLFFILGLATINWWMTKSSGSEEGVQANSKETHSISLYNSGFQSLYSRLELIKQAKTSIELEFFIFNLDEASRLLTQALIERAQQGIEVRLLVDFSAPVFQLKPIYARYLRKYGVQVRYYNTSAAYRLLSMQHRSHRKLLIVDGAAVITGGRNIGNEYFDLSQDYNFLDTDIELRGPIVQAIKKSFNLYWDSSLSRIADEIEKEMTSEELELAKSFFSEKKSDAQILEKVTMFGGQQGAKSYPCHDVTFVTDIPNQGESNRRVYQAIARELADAKSEVVAESPYFVIKQEGYDILKAATSRGVKLNFLTNGLYSTDASYSVASLFFNVKWLAKTNMELRIFEGDSIETQAERPKDGELSGAKRWGLHSKRAVIDRATILVGTYNIDPRSANLNSELMVICRNQIDLAQELLADIAARSQRSKIVIQNGNYNRLHILTGASYNQITKLFLLLPASNLFDFLL